jgi:hypothetical protein
MLAYGSIMQLSIELPISPTIRIALGASEPGTSADSIARSNGVRIETAALLSKAVCDFWSHSCRQENSTLFTAACAAI